MPDLQAIVQFCDHPMPWPVQQGNTVYGFHNLRASIVEQVIFTKFTMCLRSSLHDNFMAGKSTKT